MEISHSGVEPDSYTTALCFRDDPTVHLVDHASVNQLHNPQGPAICKLQDLLLFLVVLMVIIFRCFDVVKCHIL